MDRRSVRSWETPPGELTARSEQTSLKQSLQYYAKLNKKRSQGDCDFHGKLAGPAGHPPLVAHPFPRSWTFIHFLRCCNLMIYQLDYPSERFRFIVLARDISDLQW